MKEMLNTLARRSFAASKVRNLIAVLAIALTAVLFTSVTTIGMGATQSMSLTMQMMKMSRGDAEIKHMTAEQFENLKKADFVKEAGLRMPVGYLTNAKQHNIELDVMDETQAHLTFCSPSHGELPRSAEEIAASDRALRDLGVEPKIGEIITIEFTAHGRDYSMPMRVSGWYEAANDQVSCAIVSTAFRDANPDIFRNTFREDKETAGTYYSDIIAKSTIGLQAKLHEFSRSQGGNPEDMGADNFLPANVNTARNPQPNMNVLLIGGVFMLLFIFCGYLLIYNVFDIAVMQDIRRYGLYRTIGMGKKQVKRLINRQALWLYCMGTPIGLLLGFFIGRSTMPVIMSMFSTEYGNISADVSPSPILFLIAAVFTAFTVYLSTRKPVRAAADIPPIEAFRYVESSTGKRTRKHSAESASLPRMAFANLGRNKRRTVFVVVSLTLCVVLLNCVGTAAVSMDVEKQVSQMVRTDFAVVNAASMNLLEGFTARDMGLSEQMIHDISQQPGVTEGASIYKNTLEDMNVTYDFGTSWTDTEARENGTTVGYKDDTFSFTLGDDKRALCNVYGMEEASVSRMALKEGETDAHRLYEKMCNGEGVLLGAHAKMGSAEPEEETDFLNVGDRITVYKDGQKVKELPVLAKAALNGDDEEIGTTMAGANKVGGDGLFLYLPTEVYKDLYDEPVIYKYSFNVDEEHQEDMTAYLDNYINTKDASINYLSAESAREAAESMKNIIYFVGGIISAIFGVAGILNLVNMLITSIITRRHEFATMRSIGMTEQQLRKMITWEGVYYAVGAVFFGIVLSAGFGLTLVKALSDRMWQFTFQFTLIPAVIISAALFLFALIIPSITLRMFNRGSIVEQLGVAE